MRTFTIELLQASTGFPHPLAALPTIPWPHAYILTETPLIGIEVMGDMLAVHMLFREDMENRFVLWNWKTGRVLIVSDPATLEFLQLILAAEFTN